MNRLYDDPAYYERIQKVKLLVCFVALFVWVIA